MAPPYQNEQQVDALIAKGDPTALDQLRRDYLAYFMKNQCELVSSAAWIGLGQFFLDIARKPGANGKTMSRKQFEAATSQFLRQPIPEWINEVAFVQTDMKGGPYYLALPPQELAEQAWIHSKNPTTQGTDYVLPPIYTGFTPTTNARDILCTRITDYVVSHCG